MVEQRNYEQILKLVDESIKAVFLVTSPCEKEGSISSCLSSLGCKDSKVFMDGLKRIKKDLQVDLKFFMESDPAVDSEEEVIFAYPGYKAIVYYRIAHLLYEMGYKLCARIISEEAHSKTGIDIHPAAKIGVPFFIDHGTGIVVGETTVIGKRVILYQGVTLGAVSVNRAPEIRGKKRHPTIGDDVTIYANATILGDIKVGNDVIVGSNTYIREDIPAHTTVKNSKPELIMRSHR